MLDKEFMMADYKIDWKWVLVAAAIFLVAQLALSLVFGLLGVITLGFGFVLFLILKPVTYFLGGLLTGYVSPGVTVREPAIAAVIISIAGAILDGRGEGGGRLLGTIVAAAVAFLCALAGAQIGERMQRNR
jgi:hypothetical protein